MRDLRELVAATRPRVPLAFVPTPLEPWPGPPDASAPRLWIKRDDCTGLAFGGNKTRKLEFLVADALRLRADTLLTCGGVQSNHLRQTAAAAGRFGLGFVGLAREVLAPPPAGYVDSGNALLTALLGGGLVRMESYAPDYDGALRRAAEELRARGRRPYVIPLGGSNALGALGYMSAAQELLEQADAHGFTPEVVCTASSSAGTQAGLIAGLRALGSDAAVVGIAVDADGELATGRVLDIARGALELAGFDCDLVKADDVDLRGGFSGPGYGLANAQTLDVIREVAREGVLLDPVYTGKAAAGLFGMIARGELQAGQHVVFLHTGGAPALFAYAGQLLTRPPLQSRIGPIAPLMHTEESHHD